MVLGLVIWQAMVMYDDLVPIYLAGKCRSKSVAPQRIHNTLVEIENRLDISRATNGSHVEAYGNKVEKHPVFTLYSN